MSEPLKNWAGNLTFSAAQHHYPETVDQVQELVDRCDRIKTLGSRHSFNDIADSTGDIISLEHFEQAMSLDEVQQTVTVGAGVKYGDLARYLHREGYALHNMASLPHISVAGACATATHGSGVGNGNLATAVSAMEIVTADGAVTSVSREQHGDRFDGMVVGLGGFGVITGITLDIIPTFDMRQVIYDNLPMPQLVENFENIVSSAYSVCLFIDWQSDAVDQVWLKQRIQDGAAITASDWFGATPATDHRHPIRSKSAEGCTTQRNTQAPWLDVLPHFRMEYTPSHGEELQSEYFVPRQHAVAAIQAIAALRQHLAPIIKISEIRTVAADDLWMSTCYGRDSVALHFTWQKDWPDVKRVLPMVEAELAPFDARPHWGKLFTMSPERLQASYERLPEFRELLMAYDPEGKFRNGFIDRYIAG